jgi:hypothetical protein
MTSHAPSSPRSRLKARCAPIVVLLLFLTIVAALSGPVFAQKCSERNPNQAVAMLEHYYRVCSAPDSHDQVMEEGEKLGDFYIAAQVAGPRAIPVLRKIAALPKGSECSGSLYMVRVALAKLGDERAYAAMKELWREETPSPYLGSLGLFAQVGDDWALFTLVEYLIEHADDPRMHAEIGPSDAPYDGQSGLLQAIRDIGLVRRIPDLPAADYSPAGIVKWKEWLEKYKGQTFSKPVSESVSDPYLQCLARKVEWGHPDAMLEIARSGGKPASSVLQQFPTPSPGQPMGIRNWSPELLRHEDGGIPDLYREAQGNLQTGLAQLGDEQMLSQIATELTGFPYHWDNIPVEAVRKLKFLGGERAVGILIGALGNLKGMEQEGEKAFEQCIEPSIYSGLHRTPEQDAYIRKVCDHDRYFGHVRDVNGLLMKTLAEMVKDPPLSADARATPENFQKWRAWWAQNKDHAVVVQRPDQSFE